MTEDLHELYQSIILDHNKSPRHYGLLEAPTHRAEGYNPICGDKVEVTLKIETGIISAITFESASCAICKASASLMASALDGMQLAEIDTLENHLNGMLEGTSVSVHDSEIAALSGVSKFPSRIKCAQLPWKTLRSALNQ